MLYSCYQFNDQLNKYYDQNQDRLKEIQALEFSKRFDEVRKDLGKIPMLCIKQFLKEREV